MKPILKRSPYMTSFTDEYGNRKEDQNHVLQSAATATGNGTAMQVEGYSAAIINVSGITTATIIIEGTSDNTSWNALSVRDVNSGATATSITSNSIYSVTFEGLLNVRARISAYTSGTITVSAAPATMSVTPGAASGGGGGLSTNDGTFAKETGGNLATIVTNTNNILVKGQATMANSSPVVIASNQGAVPVNVSAQTTGGYTPGKLISAASTNATSIKTSAGTLGSLQIGGNTSTVYYVKLYDKASAPTVGTDTPVATYIVPANVTNGTGSNIPLPPQGMLFSNGIALAITGGIADTDTTACAANAVVVNYQTK